MKYDKLYLEILKIGRTSIGEGLSYMDLKEELEKKGYDFSNDCIEIAVKQWFFDCFNHIITTDYGKEKIHEKLTELSQIEKHLKCNFIMKGEMCLSLIEHEKSKRNIRIAWIALTAAIVIGAIQIWIAVYQREKETKQPTEASHQEYIPCDASNTEYIYVCPICEAYNDCHCP